MQTSFVYVLHQYSELATFSQDLLAIHSSFVLHIAYEVTDGWRE